MLGRDIEQEVEEAMARDRERGDRSWRHRHLLRVGDAVRVHGHDVHSDPRPDEFEGLRYPVGRDGVVVGYTVKSVCRFNRFPKLAAGIYQDPEWPLVRVGEWDVRRIRANYLSLPKDTWEERLARHRADHPEFNGYGPRLCDLPDTDVWEGDIVEFQSRPYTERPKARGKPFPGGFPDRPDAFVVSWMSFHQHAPGDLVESLDHLPRYALSDRLFRRSGGYYYPFELDVVERGNLWRRAHGEPAVFRDLAEEAAFALRVGEAHKVRGTGAYVDRASARVAAVKLVEAGEGDGMLFYSDFYGWGSDDGYTVLRFADRSLGDRVREATLSGTFEVPSDDEDDPAE